MLYDFGTVKKDGSVLHNTHKRRIKCLSSYEWECLLAGEELPKKWKNGEVVEWEFLEKSDHKDNKKNRRRREKMDGNRKFA